MSQTPQMGARFSLRSDSLSHINNGRTLTGSAAKWDDVTEEGTYLVSNCSDIPGNAYGYGTLVVFAVPISIYGRIQVYVPDTPAPKVYIRTRYNNAAWKAWGHVQTVAV